MAIILFVLGLIVGSFLNVLVYRLHTAEDMVFGRSKCPHCKNVISWYDNIPLLSFIILKSRCRNCKEKISWQYPIVEVLTGLIFVLIGWKFFVVSNIASWLPTAYYLFISSSLLVILIYDLLYMEIPMAVLWVGVFISIAVGLYLDWINPTVLTNTKIYSGILAAFVAFVFFFGLSAGSKEKWMGMGDVYLVILLGLIVGWPEILLALFLAFLFGAAYGTIMIVAKKKKMQSQVPFAPFLVVGTFVTLLFYWPIIDWYFSLFY